MVKIRKELADSNTAGWDFFRQVMDLIYKKSGVRYHEVHIYRILHKWGFKSKVLQKRFVNTTASKKDKRRNSKKSKTDSIQVKNGLEYSSTEDESIFVYDSILFLKERNGFLLIKDQ